LVGLRCANPTNDGIFGMECPAPGEILRHADTP
jgi:hypothetical protein